MAKNDLAAHFSELAGRKDQYDVRVVEGVDGTKQTQLIDKTTGSISAVFEGEDVNTDKIVGSVTSVPAVSPKESVNDNKKQWTSTGVLASPTQPEALQPAADATEVDNTDKSTVAADSTAETTKSQRSTPSKQREQ
jgi:hypothetical protein